MWFSQQQLFYLINTCSQNQKESVVEVEFEDVLNEEELLTPPPIHIPQDDDSRSHDDADHQHLPHPQPKLDAAPGGAPSVGSQRSGWKRNKPHKEGNIYPPGISADKDLQKKLPHAGTLKYTSNTLDESSDTVDNDPAIAKMAAEEGAL
ncbi:hypothetical protein M413DRAFT_13916 [Hebeloma cylindrosporum]|uniref:Uncharacterized protein n=1 Tax=Hebeloma cylindrosporum TaxID=76867 RepID=A0A0C3BYU6_HEBCY|nr:hypothetical protein M413DRAFT_13916 [Hebeloma cylindrosporum h7]